ncbi:MAG TPA: FtsX-like permease family protein [Streptosporangiaceae bacterium]|nr:FtsX-like permease family protein [Streptosporangiaceae bacterium]
MTTVLRDPPDLDSGAGGGLVARRAVFRWGWRLFRREWRQQLLVLGLLTVAVGATVWGAGVVTNAQLASPNYPAYGTAAAKATLPGTDPDLAADIASIQRGWGPADVIERRSIATGTTQSVQLRAENPHGHFNAPLLSLVSGAYPAGPGQVALTSQVAALYGAHVGGTWRAAGRTWRVTGIAADPSNLADEFALVAPGQVKHPSQVIMLLGPAAARLASSNGDVTLPGVPAAALAVPNEQVGGFPQATLILVVEVLGLAFIGLVSVTSFSVMAQRRLRALGMLSAIGATGRNLRLVMIVNGLVVGVAGALAGAVLGLAAWFAYVPTLQRASGHVVDRANLPWWAFAIGVAFAIATSVLASRRPAKTMAAVPVVTALSGRPAPPKAVHRSALPGVIVFAFGLACLAFAGGQAGPPGGGNGPNPGGLLVVLGGLVGTIAGLILLAPLAIGVLAAGARPRLPVAIRIALRDLVRYRARSGAALAAVTFAAFLATVICLVGSERTANPLNPSGPNLSSSQLLVTAGSSPSQGMMNRLTSAQEASLSRRLDSLAASLHARSAIPLEGPAATLSVAGLPPHSNNNFTGSVYLATPQLLATYGIKASQIAPHTDFLTSRPGLAGLSNMQMIWQSSGNGGEPDSSSGPPGISGPSCTLSNDCLASPAIQTFSNLPSGTDAPNTLITEYAVSRYHLQASQLSGWLIQAPAPLTAAQIRAARHVVLAYQAPLEIASGGTDFGEIADFGTALGILIALGVLAASVGLIRSETARDLRTLTATGASATTRRTITAATAAALGLLGAVLGMAFALVASLVWAHGGLSALFADVPLADGAILLLGLPLVAAVGGWLFAGRKLPAIARQPIE